MPDSFRGRLDVALRSLYADSRGLRQKSQHWRHINIVVQNQYPRQICRGLGLGVDVRWVWK